MILLSGTDIRPLDNQVNLEPSLIPKPPFSTMVCASKGSGKTVMLLNMLLSKDILAGKFNQIFIVSPTNKLDAKWEHLKTTDGVISTNKKLINLINKNGKKQRIFDSHVNNGEVNFDTRIPESNFIEDVDIDLLKKLKQEQSYIIKKYGKENADKILIVYDDTAGERRFWNSNEVRKLIFNMRHFNISIIITTQSYFSIPKNLRLNMSQLVLFFTSNEKELKTIYEEHASKVKQKEFLQIVKNTWNTKPFNFFVINYQNTQQHIFQDSFSKYII